MRNHISRARASFRPGINLLMLGGTLYFISFFWAGYGVLASGGSVLALREELIHLPPYVVWGTRVGLCLATFSFVAGLVMTAYCLAVRLKARFQ